MDVVDYTGYEDEYDRVLDEAEPCNECKSKDDLMLVMITDDVEHFGKILLLCARCHIHDTHEEEINELTEQSL